MSIVYNTTCFRSSAKHSGGLLEVGVAGETSLHCHDHQPGGGREDQVSEILA